MLEDAIQATVSANAEDDGFQHVACMAKRAIEDSDEEEGFAQTSEKNPHPLPTKTSTRISVDQAGKQDAPPNADDSSRGTQDKLTRRVDSFGSVILIDRHGSDYPTFTEGTTTTSTR